MPVSMNLFLSLGAHTQCVDPSLNLFLDGGDCYQPSVSLHEDLTSSQGQTRFETGLFQFASAAVESKHSSA